MAGDKLEIYMKRWEDVFQSIIRRLHNELGKNLVKGITGSQVFVMKKIHERGRSTVSEVAEDLCVSLSAVTSLVDKLCKFDYVNRQRDDNDRRLVWLELTPKGNDILGTCLSARRQVVQRYLRQLPEEDIEKLLDIYEKLLKIMQAEDAGDK
ncbi:transcriptional regulator, MarR family [Desulfofarcimen acetoxidans DSM 771]|jgi:DNA-binding MarR family transcriptional regulator|uniref:Transcriptional regulator, MarR family n=1 Tax=Desulfofarcimen acetoxidans (strain ATCC 49208 / DSM 771 / KCTC 5769 / VKM B-1644 / 5575) TaxID=485916 RepID=C8VYU8_DESAS|nr:MarR family transcriptional regulator [Desulfofarcimen acetoxidans]ACV64819.1 transcriptional regulator, MarR family [Desulfofarcimen acetoxidans DSM 771]